MYFMQKERQRWYTEESFIAKCMLEGFNDMEEIVAITAPKIEIKMIFNADEKLPHMMIDPETPSENPIHLFMLKIANIGKSYYAS